MRKFYLILLLLTVITYNYWQSPKTVEDQRYACCPEQIDLEQKLGWEFKDFNILPLAKYKIEARVLSRENYWLGVQSQLSPIDLALGWGEMSRTSIYNKLKISQGGRWYSYSWDSAGPPIEVSEIIKSSANVHIIPANEKIAKKLKRVKRNDTIRLQGYLVRIENQDKTWHWESSLTREDSGDGACEVLWVEELNFI